jgi:hypothetical protein
MKFSKEQFFQENQKEEDINLNQKPFGAIFLPKKKGTIINRSFFALPKHNLTSMKIPLSMPAFLKLHLALVYPYLL